MHPAAAVAVTCLAGVAMATAPAHAAGKRSDLTVRSLTGTPASIAAGGAFTARAAVRNVGRAKARRSAFVFALSRDAQLGRTDSRLASVTIKALRPRKDARAQARLSVPATLARGEYRLLACADAGRVVRERRENNNCRA